MGLQRVGHTLTIMSFSCLFPAGVIGQMVMLFVETEQSRGSKSGKEEDGLSFTDVEFEVWVHSDEATEQTVGYLGLKVNREALIGFMQL